MILISWWRCVHDVNCKAKMCHDITMTSLRPWSLTWNQKMAPLEKEVPFEKASFSGSLLNFGGVYRPYSYMGVSKNKGTPKSSIVIGFSFINHPFWGFSPNFRKPPHNYMTGFAGRWVTSTPVIHALRRMDDWQWWQSLACAVVLGCWCI